MARGLTASRADFTKRLTSTSAMAHRDATSLIFSGNLGLTPQDIDGKLEGIPQDKRVGRLENRERLEIGALDSVS